MVDGDVRPLVIVDESGAIVEIARMNAKGFNKSRENGALWTLHAETDRLLPHAAGGALLTIADRGGWYQAVVGASTAGTVAVSSEEAALAGETLRSLEARILERKRELPEGSYTAYLFKSGGDKIRKKTGEEAVEVLLARSPEELARESADLLYHLVVLLASEGVTIEDVLRILAERST